MIKKIKKYKLSLRPSYIARNLKKKLPQDTPWQDAMEADIQKVIRGAEPFLDLSSIYETFSQVDCPAPLKELWGRSPKGAISISLIATTIGPKLEERIASLQNENDAFNAALMGSIAQEALEQSTHFVSKLLAEESKLEHCDCTPSLPLEPAFIKDSLDILQSHKADIHAAEGGGIVPLYSTVSFCFWNPRKKH